MLLEIAKTVTVVLVLGLAGFMTVSGGAALYSLYTGDMDKAIHLGLASLFLGVSYVAVFMLIIAAASTVNG